MTTIKKGDKITCYGDRTTERNLTRGKVYEALTDEVPGIFPDRPYITVIDDNGERYFCHASRFKNPA